MFDQNITSLSSLNGRELGDNQCVKDLPQRGALCASLMHTQRVLGLAGMEEKYFNVHGMEDLLRVYSKTKVVIGSRMHSMIIAMTQGIPVIGLCWQAKIKSLFDMLEINEFLFEIEKFEPSDICDIIANEASVLSLKQNIEKKVKKMRLLYNVNFGLCNQLLKR